AGARVTGLDFSSAAIDAARDIAQRAGLADRADFVCANVYDALTVLEPASFDVVYVSLGALCLLPSVDAWAEQCAGLLAPGLRLDRREEHDWTAWPRFPWLLQNAEGNWTNPPDMPRVALSFSLLACKPA